MIAPYLVLTLMRGMPLSDVHSTTGSKKNNLLAVKIYILIVFFCALIYICVSGSTRGYPWLPLVLPLALRTSTDKAS